MANENIDLTSIYDEIDGVMAETDLSNVSAESTGFEDLPYGYYLTQVIETKIGRSKSTQKPMITIVLEVVEDGLKLSDSTDEIVFDSIKGTTKRHIYKNYTIKDSKSLKNFVSDMKKFEDPNEIGKSLLPDEAWTSAKYMGVSIPLLAEINCRIWLHNRESKKSDGTSGSWVDLVSFNQAAKIGLPVED